MVLSVKVIAVMKHSIGLQWAEIPLKNTGNSGRTAEVTGSD